MYALVFIASFVIFYLLKFTQMNHTSTPPYKLWGVWGECHTGKSHAKTTDFSSARKCSVMQRSCEFTIANHVIESNDIFSAEIILFIEQRNGMCKVSFPQCSSDWCESIKCHKSHRHYRVSSTNLRSLIIIYHSCWCCTVAAVRWVTVVFVCHIRQSYQQYFYRVYYISWSKHF